MPERTRFAFALAAGSAVMWALTRVRNRAGAERFLVDPSRVTVTEIIVPGVALE